MARAALATGQQALTDYAHRFSPKKYTQPQLFACLVLKRYFKVDYRGIMAYLQDMPTICQTLELTSVPHWTTLQKAERRLLSRPVTRDLLDGSLKLILGDQRKTIQRAAVDSTGLQAGRVSPYFVRRRSRKPNLWQTTTYTRYPKLAMVCDTTRHLILSCLTGRGPSPDVTELPTLLDHLSPQVSIHHLLADAGYDSEWNHTYAREDHGMLTTIPAKIGRPTNKPPSGRYRRLMHDTLNRRPWYGQRWQVETVNSMIKRNPGHTIHATTYHAQTREMGLAVLTHNIAILLFGGGVLPSTPDPFSSP